MKRFWVPDRQAFTPRLWLGLVASFVLAEAAIAASWFVWMPQNAWEGLGSGVAIGLAVSEIVYRVRWWRWKRAHPLRPWATRWQP